MTKCPQCAQWVNSRADVGTRCRCAAAGSSEVAVQPPALRAVKRRMKPVRPRGGKASTCEGSLADVFELFGRAVESRIEARLAAIEVRLAGGATAPVAVAAREAATKLIPTATTEILRSAQDDKAGLRGLSDSDLRLALIKAKCEGDAAVWGKCKAEFARRHNTAAAIERESNGERAGD